MIDTPAEVVTDHLQRLGALKLEKAPWLPLWQDVTDYVAPRRTSWDDEAQEGKKPPKSYDGTAVADLQTLVDGFMGNLVSEAFPWLRTVTETPETLKQPWVADYLEDLDELFLSWFQRNGMYAAMNEYIYDLGSLGTAAMLIDDDLSSRGIVFSTRHLKEYYIAENRNGQVDVLYRRFRMTNRQAIQAWPGKVDERRKEQARKLPFAKNWYVHAVYPSGDDGFKWSRDPSMPWTSCYIDESYRTELEQGGYDDFPYIVGRWRKNSDETYGRSPGIDAINDVLRVNEMAMTLLQSAQLSVAPPMNIPESMRGSERLVPRGRNYYTRPDMKAETINMGQGYPIGRDQVEQVREQIHEIFRKHVFMILQMLEGQKAQTATWVNKIASEQAIVLGPVVGRFNTESLHPMVRRTYNILARKGVLPPAPPALAQGARVKLQLMGPLAQAQRRYHQSQGVLAGTEFLKAMMELNPESSDNADFDELTRIGLDLAGTPQKIIRETPAVAAFRRARQEALAKQQQAEAQAQEQALVTQNANKLNAPVKAGSMLEKLSAGRRR